jgi:hypothetical protein
VFMGATTPASVTKGAPVHDRAGRNRVP